jgi:CheY-like chemotaxis protein
MIRRMVQKSCGTILMVDDSADDALLLQDSLERDPASPSVQWVPDGNEAILYLCGQGRYADRARHPLPMLILLDLKMPIKHGFEVLQFVRSYPAFASIPVVVHSDCFDPRIVKRAYELGANSFIRKAADVKTHHKIAEALKNYWLETNTVPQDVLNLDL